MSQALSSPPIAEQDFVRAFDDDQDDALESVVSLLSLPHIHNTTHSSSHSHNDSTAADTFTDEHGFLPVHLPKKFTHARTHHTPSKGNKPLPPGVARAIDSSTHTKKSNTSPGRSGVSSLVPSGSTISCFDTPYEYISAHIMIYHTS